MRYAKRSAWKGYSQNVLGFLPEEISKDVRLERIGLQVNRKVEDIKETIFKVVVKDGKYELTVIEQKSK